MVEDALVRFENVDGIGVITIDNPPVNALSPGVPEGIVENIERGNAVIGRALVAGAPRDRFAYRIEDAGIGLRFGELVVAVADARQRPLLGDPLGEG
ncbi:MAG TPA: hypothetical protein VE687_12525, partial [Stellaceae bacterium]|nr:hypothetical protein [Stellaceae bacterium]